jgi:hypothetical protein
MSENRSRWSRIDEIWLGGTVLRVSFFHPGLMPFANVECVVSHWEFVGLVAD